MSRSIPDKSHFTWNNNPNFCLLTCITNTIRGRICTMAKASRILNSGPLVNNWTGGPEISSFQVERAIVVRDVPWNWLWYPPCARDFSFQRHPLVNHVSNFRNSPPCYVYITYVYLAILGGVEETCFVTNGENFYQFLTRMYPFIQRIKYFRIDIYLFIYLFI